MKYNELCSETVSALGFGTMRLPLLEDKTIDQEQVNRMTDYAIEHGINYFDTAYPYHEGYSELALAKALSKYPRDKYYIADKFPGHQFMKEYDCKGIFEDQLNKCRVEHFDFYLLHNIYENSLPTYKNKEYGIIEYFAEQRKNGKIRHLGFSTHARAENLESILDLLEERMGFLPDFCQIQLNYMDWTLQDGRAKVELLEKKGMPIVVMEPLRGGKLADVGDGGNARLKDLRPEDSVASWSFRWLERLDSVKVILSGMSDFSQMQDNVKTFSEDKPLSEEEVHTLEAIAEDLKQGVPCTACRYCCDGCPMELDIPMLLAGYNDMKFQQGMTVPMQMDGTPEEKRPDKCIGCGACAAVCPQQIDIPAALGEFADILDKSPSWRELCRQREEAAERLKQSKKQG